MNTLLKNKLDFLAKTFFLILLLLSFNRCNMDEDMNYRILVVNNCDFALKVYYDNQDIETHENGWNNYKTIGSVTIVLPHQDKEIYSKYTSVWIEPVDQIQLNSRKFRSVNDGAWRKLIEVYKQDFEFK